jgi:hypothetical protein
MIQEFFDSCAKALCWIARPDPQCDPQCPLPYFEQDHRGISQLAGAAFERPRCVQCGGKGHQPDHRRAKIIIGAGRFLAHQHGLESESDQKCGPGDGDPSSSANFRRAAERQPPVFILNFDSARRYVFDQTQ